MEIKSTSSQLPTALRIGNTATTDKSTINNKFNKHCSTAGHAFHLATPTPANISAPPAETCSGSLYGGATGFNSQADFFLCIYQWCCSCCWWIVNCNCFATMAYLLPYLLTSFAHTVYRFFYCVIDCTFVYPMCNSVFLSHCFALSWPGRSCK